MNRLVFSVTECDNGLIVRTCSRYNKLYMGKICNYLKIQKPSSIIIPIVCKKLIKNNINKTTYVPGANYINAKIPLVGGFYAEVKLSCDNSPMTSIKNKTEVLDIIRYPTWNSYDELKRDSSWLYIYAAYCDEVCKITIDKIANINNSDEKYNNLYKFGEKTKYKWQIDTDNVVSEKYDIPVFDKSIPDILCCSSSDKVLTDDKKMFTRQYLCYFNYVIRGWLLNNIDIYQQYNKNGDIIIEAEINVDKKQMIIRSLSEATDDIRKSNLTVNQKITYKNKQLNIRFI